jgi:flagellar protein FliO/FliZ
MTPSLFGPLAAFVAVLALIPFALWLLKRSPLGAGASANGLRVVAALPLAPNQRVVTVEVGSGEQRQWLVLGVTPAGIRTLHTLAPQAEAPAATPRGGSPFAQLLSRQARPAGDHDAR